MEIQIRKLENGYLIESNGISGIYSRKLEDYAKNTEELVQILRDFLPNHNLSDDCPF